MSTVVDPSSRYRRVPRVTVVDARRGVVVATDVRSLPATTGAYLHTIAAGDRLDRLAWTFYGDPLQYWRICDANPDFLSPLALLGQEAFAVTHFAVSVAAGEPPWSALLETLAATVGVQDVTVVEWLGLEGERRTVNGTDVPVTVQRADREVVVTYHPGNIDPSAIIELIEAAGFTVRSVADGGRIGRSVVVPDVDPG
jgi:hypothetical protein